MRNRIYNLLRFYAAPIVLCLVVITSANAQDTTQNAFQALKDEIKSVAPSGTNFMLRGYGHFGLDASEDKSNFTAGSFNPIFLWRQGDNFIFESELELEFENNELEIGLEYANASYIFKNGLIVRAGKFLLPFGIFTDRLHAAWINKFRTAPLGIGHDGIAPASDVGISLSGGYQVGSSKINFSAYIVNGPTLNDGQDEPEEAGLLHFNNTDDNNKNKAVGGRIGFLPFSNSSLELGISAIFAKPGSEHSPFEDNPAFEDINYKDVTASLFAGDLSYVKLISQIKGILDIKGQYNMSSVSKADYVIDDSTRYTFDNNSTAYFAQLAYRPSQLGNKFIKNIEVAGRYAFLETPEGSMWHTKQTQTTLGLNYWITWRTVIKFSYQKTDFTNNDDDQGHNDNISDKMYFIHLAVGL